MSLLDVPLQVHGEEVLQSGVDHGGRGLVVARNARSIAVKWPGCKYWSGREEHYASPSVDVYLVNGVSVRGNGVEDLEIENLLQWQNGRSEGSNRATPKGNRWGFR